jgi:hypothetical protein
MTEINIAFTDLKKKYKIKAVTNKARKINKPTSFFISSELIVLIYGKPEYLMALFVSDS